MGHISNDDSRWLHGLVADNKAAIHGILKANKEHYILVPNCWGVESDSVFRKNYHNICEFAFYSFTTEEELLFMMMSLSNSKEYITLSVSEI